VLSSRLAGHKRYSQALHAADNEKIFDAKLPKRKRYLHTFTGVDYHLQASIPLTQQEIAKLRSLGIKELAGSSLTNTVIHNANLARVENLLKIAAVVKINSVRGGWLNVDVANLATGHHLPAGFAFAREMWHEVGERPRGSRGAFAIIIGGDGAGKPLAADAGLNKYQRGLKNFQAVLFNEDIFNQTGSLSKSEEVL
jgi:hypothetical protein